MTQIILIFYVFDGNIEGLRIEYPLTPHNSPSPKQVAGCAKRVYLTVRYSQPSVKIRLDSPVTVRFYKDLWILPIQLCMIN